MSKSITSLRIKDGVLQVSYDNGCHYEDIGQVGGADGKDGTNGSVCTIDPVTKHWLIDGVDTGVLAEGVDGINGNNGIDGMDGMDGIPYSIIAAPGENIAVVGTPSVSTSSDSVTKTTTFTFNYLKGEKGEDGKAPEITAERIDANNSVVFSVDDVPVVTLYDGIRYTAGNHIVITPTDISHSVIACDLVAGSGININSNNEIELVSTVPTEKNELIYSDDGTTLTTHPLMFTGGLVVDTHEDLVLCESSATSDEMILDVTPGENKVYKKSNGVWVVQNTTSQLVFQNGSRIAWNRITDKLFYNDGASIYRISAVSEYSAGYGLLLSKTEMSLDTTVLEDIPTSNVYEIDYNSPKYIRLSVHNDSTTTINVKMLAALIGTKSAHEIVVRVDNVDSSESGPAVVKIAKTAASGVTGTIKNMYDPNIANGTGISLFNGDSMEMVFTFWDKNDVTFNGGEEIGIL